jgi:hypothetical protein
LIHMGLQVGIQLRELLRRKQRLAIHSVFMCSSAASPSRNAG